MNRQYSSKTAARILCALFVLIAAAAAVAGPVESVQAQAPAQQQAAGGVTDTWAVQISPGTDPDQLALQMGAQNLGQIGSLTGYYLFRIPGTDSEATAMADVFAASSQLVWFEQQVARQQSKRVIEDPVYLDQWHLVDANVEPAWNAGFTGTGVTIAIVDDGLQYTHADLGGQYNSAASYDFKDGDSDPMPDPVNSYINPDPPFNVISVPDDHGTPVAGIAAADYNGNTNPQSCGVGVAYDANLAGLRLVAGDGFTTDFQQASALSYAPNINSIYNNSWGPFDDAQRLEGPGTLASAALQKGVTTGRNGKGSIYVWAAGNGRSTSDNVNYDGYANSRFTIAVGAVDNSGQQASYSEPGAAMLVTAPSGSDLKPGIVTTDLLGHFGYSFDTDCTPGNFTGTSASAPIVSGVVALMLDANPNLGWRDVQNILARTAVKNDPADTETIPNPIDPVDGDPVTVSTWVTNGAGLHVNHKYGFGLVDAGVAVAMAADPAYINLPRATSFSSGNIPVNVEIPDRNADPYQDGVVSEYVVTQDITLEHVEVVFNAPRVACNPDIEPPRTLDCDDGYRGDLKLVLTSPSGTQSILAEKHADAGDDYAGWKFMTVRNWGESSLGTWSLKVTDQSGGTGYAMFDSWQLNLHGTGGTQKTFGDYNGDGFADLAVFRPETGMWIVKDWTTNTEIFRMPWGGGADKLVPEDYNGDGKTDIAVWRASSMMWIVKDWATETEILRKSWGGPTDIPVPGDYNGDGHADLAVFRPSTGMWIVKDWETDTEMFRMAWGGGADKLVPADYNGDGKTDIAVWRSSTMMWIAKDWATNTEILRMSWGGPTDIPIPYDFNGDGKADLAVFRPSTGMWIVKDWTTDTELFRTPWGGGVDKLTPGDFNGDGRMDVAVWRSTSMNWIAKDWATNIEILRMPWGGPLDVPLYNLQKGK